MAPNGGHLLVAKTMRLIRFGVEKARVAVRDRLTQIGPAEAHTERVYARIQEQPLTRLQAIRKAQHRNYTTNTRRFISNAVRYVTESGQSRPLRSSYPASRTRSAVQNLTGRTPFASTLRPNLTGGALPRTAGGYGTGTGRIGGARFFSHGPAQPAEVIQNVSQAVRAFWLQGHKARFNGYDQQTGAKRFRAISASQEKARNAFDTSNARSAGSFIEFKVNPTITAVGPLSTVAKADTYDSCTAPLASLDESVMTTLAVDFARALKDLAAVMNDLKRLATLGSLPLILINPTTLRVRFPGCDRDTVEALCVELNIRRGIVGQDEDFSTQHGEDVALRFPFAPSKTTSEADLCEIYDGWRPKRLKKDHVDWHAMISEKGSDNDDLELVHEPAVGFLTSEGEIVDNPWTTQSREMSDYSSLHLSDHAEEPLFFKPDHRRYGKRKLSDGHNYEGIEGIYRFIEQCDQARM